MECRVGIAGLELEDEPEEWKEEDVKEFAAVEIGGIWNICPIETKNFLQLGLEMKANFGWPLKILLHR